MCTTQSLYQAIDQGITKTVTTVNSHGKFFEAKLQELIRTRILKLMLSNQGEITALLLT